MKISACQLYVILDKKCQRGRSFLETARAAIEGGADCIQLRDKDLSAKQLIREGVPLRELTRRTRTLLIVNDRFDVARALDADGVHLGQEDPPIRTAREFLDGEKIVGQSTHSLEQARRAEQEGADYIGVGPVFATPTKPSYQPVGLSLVKQVSRVIQIPFFAIGGIDQTNIEEVLKKGASRVAVVRAVSGAENVEKAAKRFKEIIVQQKNQMQPRDFTKFSLKCLLPLLELLR